MPSLKCIYCLHDVPPEGFNTEHVILEAFGKFKSNLTLNKVVCRACNQFFGDHIDRILARDSFEATTASSTASNRLEISRTCRRTG
jgi:hypothetical protein